MTGSRMLVGAALVATAACIGRSTNSAAPAGAETTVAAVWPAGDVRAGRQAFVDLKCVACHAVAAERDFPKPLSSNPGPTLGPATGTTDPSYLATAILSPSHAISPEMSPEVRAGMWGLSPMGDLSRAMTVRQMIDLHAYLRAANDPAYRR